MCQLINLETLYLSYNHSLTTIPESLFSISTLQKVECEECEALTSPPLAVCKQGVSAVRKYFSDLKLDEGRNCRFIPVTFIGQSKAGKTSLVRSIQQNKRVLTERNPDDVSLDEATRVFNVCEAEASESAKFIFADFAGHEIYHVSYQLTFKTQCVPLLVIDISEFDRLATLNGVESACRELCLDWLSHLYLSCPRLMRPIVALTHRDKVHDQCFNHRKQQLVDTTEKLRKTIVKTEKAISKVGNPVFTMTNFTNTSIPIVKFEEVLDFSSTSSLDDIENLRQVLAAAGKGLVTEIPGSWLRQLLKISEQTDRPFITLSEIDEEVPDDEHVTLQYFHESGRLMWFRTKKNLSTVIFHRADVLASVIGLVYNHTLDEAWRKRLNGFISFIMDGEVIEKSRYEQMIESFTNSGVMNAILLHHLLEKESSMPVEISVEVLKTFHLLHLLGLSDWPLHQKKYIFPYFAKLQVVAPEIYNQLIPLKVDLFLRGFPVPSYVFSLVTAAYLDMTCDPLSYPEVCKNGAVVTKDDGTVRYLLHDSTERQLTLITLTPPNKIGEAWQDLLTTLCKLIRELCQTWEGIRYESVFYCSHCLLSNKPSPTKTIDPDWFKQEDFWHKHSYEFGIHYSGEETSICTAEEDRMNRVVPKPLMAPCECDNVTRVPC